VITGLNHVTLSVSDIDRAINFYGDLLGFAIRLRGPASAYLEAGTFWLALVADSEVRRGPLPEYSHLAFSVAPDDLQILKEILIRAGVAQWQEPATPHSFYFLDPDGHKLELHSGDLQSRLRDRGRVENHALNG
jgi:catechol 2,3-dioxygenase-like lactoylglutathione lyase family enzyme